jgi:hypothetical protein
MDKLIIPIIVILAALVILFMGVRIVCILVHSGITGSTI